MNARTELNSYLDQFRERLRKLVLARGGSVLAVAALLVTLAAVWFGTRRAFADEFMLGARLVLLAILVAIAVTLFWLPLRKLRRTRAVPEIERRAPGFDGRIETYEGLIASERRSPFLVLLAEVRALPIFQDEHRNGVTSIMSWSELCANGKRCLRSRSALWP